MFILYLERDLKISSLASQSLKTLKSSTFAPKDSKFLITFPLPPNEEFSVFIFTIGTGASGEMREESPQKYLFFFLLN